MVFLSVKNGATNIFVETDNQYREKGELILNVAHHSCNVHPLCFVAKYDLSKEYDSDNGLSQREKILNIINRDRDCKRNYPEFGFIEYKQGFSPKEHYELKDKERVEFILREQRKSDHRWGITLVVVAGVFTIIGAVIGAVISSS